MRHPGDLPTLTAFVRDTGSFEKGFRLTFGITTFQFADLFHNYLEEKYGKFESFLQTIPYFSVITILLIAAYLVKKYRMQKKLREWDDNDNDTAQ